MKKIVLSILGLNFLLPSCTSAKEVECFKSSSSLVNALYIKFPITGKNAIENANKTVLSNFFNDGLTKLLLEDQECADKTGGLCNIDFSIMTHQQDSVSKYKILQATKNVVTVKLEYPQYSEFLDYMIDNSSTCMKIKNIKYDDNASLLKILSK